MTGAVVTLGTHGTSRTGTAGGIGVGGMLSPNTGGVICRAVRVDTVGWAGVGIGVIGAEVIVVGSFCIFMTITTPRSAPSAVGVDRRAWLSPLGIVGCGTRTIGAVSPA